MRTKVAPLPGRCASGAERRVIWRAHVRYSGSRRRRKSKDRFVFVVARKDISRANVQARKEPEVVAMDDYNSRAAIKVSIGSRTSGNSMGDSNCNHAEGSNSSGSPKLIADRCAARYQDHPMALSVLAPAGTGKICGVLLRWSNAAVAAEVRTVENRGIKMEVEKAPEGNVVALVARPRQHRS